MSESMTPNLVDLRWLKSSEMLYQLRDQIIVKIAEFQQFFSEGGIGLFRNIPKNTPREWCQEAWHQIWLTYDDRKVRIYGTKCGPNKRQNCRISTVFSEGGIGIFWNIPKNNPREYFQEAWYQIWLTYDDRKVVKSCTNCVRIFVRIRKKNIFYA